MSMTKIDFPVVGATDWTNFIDITKDWIIGHNGISLTNYENDTLPAIAQGSKVEIGGSYFYAGSDQAVTGTPASGFINYIYIQTDGTVVWSTTVPAWDSAKTGWYNGTDRCVGGVYYDGTNYGGKFILRGQDSWPLMNASGPPTGNVRTGSIATDGYRWVWSGNGWVTFILPVPHNSYIWKASCWGNTGGGNMTVSISRNAHIVTGGQTVIAQMSQLGGTTFALTDTTINQPYVDLSSGSYFVKAEITSYSSTAYLYGVMLDIILRKG